MSMMQAVRSVFSQYFGFEGRARRSEFWKFFLFNMIITFAGYLIGALTGAEQGSFFPMGLIGIYTLAALLPGLAVAVRRMHDTGRTGWSVLIILIPLVGVILYFVWACRDSDPGDNAYGKNPKNLFNAEVKPAARPTVEPVVKPRVEPVVPVSRTTNCPACGAPVSETAAFCTRCGTSLRGTARPAVRPDPVEKKAAEKSPVDDLWQTPTDF